MTAYAQPWSPLAELESLLAGAERAWSTAGTTPGINVYAKDDAAVVTSELPGVNSADVQVQLHEDILTITAERKPSAEAGTTWLIRERPVLRFSRSVSLPFQVDPDQVEARMKDGLLTVALKRAAADRPRRIQITTN